MAKGKGKGKPKVTRNRRPRSEIIEELKGQLSKEEIKSAAENVADPDSHAWIKYMWHLLPRPGSKTSLTQRELKRVKNLLDAGEDKKAKQLEALLLEAKASE